MNAFRKSSTQYATNEVYTNKYTRNHFDYFGTYSPIIALSEDFIFIYEKGNVEDRKKNNFIAILSTI